MHDESQVMSKISEENKENEQVTEKPLLYRKGKGKKESGYQVNPSPLSSPLKVSNIGSSVHSYHYSSDIWDTP